MKYIFYSMILLIFVMIFGGCADTKKKNEAISVNSDSVAKSTFEINEDSLVEKKEIDSLVKKKQLSDLSVFYIGIWKPYMYIALPIAALDDQQVNEMMKTEIDISPDSVELFSFKCFQPSYNLSVVLTKEYLADNYPKVDKDYLKLKSDSLTILNFTCNSTSVKNNDEDGLNELFYDPKRNELIIGRDGVFFFCKKKK
jgi:hypothetical protein